MKNTQPKFTTMPTLETMSMHDMIGALLIITHYAKDTPKEKPILKSCINAFSALTKILDDEIEYPGATYFAPDKSSLKSHANTSPFAEPYGLLGKNGNSLPVGNFLNLTNRVDYYENPYITDTGMEYINQCIDAKNMLITAIADKKITQNADTMLDYLYLIYYDYITSSMCPQGDVVEHDWSCHWETILDPNDDKILLEELDSLLNYKYVTDLSLETALKYDDPATITDDGRIIKCIDDEVRIMHWELKAMYWDKDPGGRDIVPAVTPVGYKSFYDFIKELSNNDSCFMLLDKALHGNLGFWDDTLYAPMLRSRLYEQMTDRIKLIRHKRFKLNKNTTKSERIFTQDIYDIMDDFIYNVYEEYDSEMSSARRTVDSVLVLKDLVNENKKFKKLFDNDKLIRIDFSPVIDALHESTKNLIKGDSMFAAIAYKMNQDNLTPIENADLEKAVENMLCLYLTRLEQLTGIVKALYTVNGAIIPDNLIHLKDGKISDIKGTECYLEYEGGLMDALKKELGVPVGGQMMMQITELKDRLTDLARNDMPAEYKIDRLWATNGYDRLMHLLTGYDCGTIIRFMFSHNQLLSDEIFNIAKTEITPDNEHFDVNKQRELSGKRLQNTYKM